MPDEKLELEELRSRVRPILRRHDVSRAELFGSYARGEQDEESDVDLVVEFEGEKTLVDISRLRKELENSLGKDVDVLTYNSVHPNIRKRVEEEAVEI
ncbi:MAG: nucleotidyltransferase family protein [Candidatus Nanohalobium sp.]